MLCLHAFLFFFSQTDTYVQLFHSLTSANVFCPIVGSCLLHLQPQFVPMSAIVSYLLSSFSLLCIPLCECIGLTKMTGMTFRTGLKKEFVENKNSWLVRGQYPFDDSDLREIGFRGGSLPFFPSLLQLDTTVLNSSLFDWFPILFFFFFLPCLRFGSVSIGWRRSVKHTNIVNHAQGYFFKTKGNMIFTSDPVAAKRFFKIAQKKFLEALTTGSTSVTAFIRSNWLPSQILITPTRCAILQKLLLGAWKGNPRI